MYILYYIYSKSCISFMIIITAIILLLSIYNSLFIIRKKECGEKKDLHPNITLSMKINIIQQHQADQ